MGKAINWQEKIIEALSETDALTFFNPRRLDWDSSWKQELTNPQFYQQVVWELNALEAVDHIIMYFDPNTKSPISLLELGLYAEKGKLWVCCPDGFWKKGNVDIICEQYHIPTFYTLDDLIEQLKENYQCRIKW